MLIRLLWPKASVWSVTGALFGGIVGWAIPWYLGLESILGTGSAVLPGFILALVVGLLYLRIPEVSKAKNYHNAIYNLKRMHNLPYIHICGQPLYPREAIDEWIRSKTEKAK